MYLFITTLHIIIAVLLILIVLLQSGKGAGISGIFGGGGGADQLFSAPSGGSFLRKATVTLAVIFVLTSITMTVISSRKELTSVTTTQRQ